MDRNCSKDCINCEMLIRGENIVFIRNDSMNNERHILRAVKCGRFGQYSTSVDDLPKSEILDDFIYE